MAPGKKAKPSEYTQRRYLDAGLAILAERGHAGLKLAALCDATGTTTGSFYHAFGSWADFRSALIRFWHDEQSQRLIADARDIADPRERLDVLTGIGLRLPHATEAAIRVWAAHDPEVLAIQQTVDHERRDIIAATYDEVIHNRDEAEEFATAAMYLLIGFESGTLHSHQALARGFRTILDRALESTRDST
ncbi:TetR/AcrR family transcriptional regulator [Gordonia terrae]|uniref:TetR/AcrR family transcriptional regulator n=1 Tax=Gordonia terrae TaxID=2055 RepID=UPI003F6BC9D7